MPALVQLELSGPFFTYEEARTCLDQSSGNIERIDLRAVSFPEHEGERGAGFIISLLEAASKLEALVITLDPAPDLNSEDKDPYDENLATLFAALLERLNTSIDSEPCLCPYLLRFECHNAVFDTPALVLKTLKVRVGSSLPRLLQVLCTHNSTPERRLPSRDCETTSLQPPPITLQSSRKVATVRKHGVCTSKHALTLASSKQQFTARCATEPQRVLSFSFGFPTFTLEPPGSIASALLPPSHQNYSSKLSSAPPTSYARLR